MDAGFGRKHRKIEFDVSALNLFIKRKTGVSKDLDHPAIVRVRNRPEAGETSARSQQRQSLEKMRADTLALESIFDGKGHFCTLGVTCDIGPCADNDFFSFLTASDHECQFLVGIGGIAKRPYKFQGRFRNREEAVLAGLGRKPMEEVTDGRSIFNRGDADRCGGAVTQDNPSEFRGILIRSRYI